MVLELMNIGLGCRQIVSQKEDDTTSAHIEGLMES